MRTIPCNPNAQPEVKEVLEYLSQIEGKGILTGQHTQTMEQPEIWRIEKLTGKLPAICGFELLSYSPNIRRETADEGSGREYRYTGKGMGMGRTWRTYDLYLALVFPAGRKR